MLRGKRMRPEMSVGERVTGTALEMPLEMLRLFECFERNIHFQFPRKKFGGVGTSAGIMFHQTLFQVGGVSNVAFLRPFLAFNDVGIKHHAKSRRWPAIRSSEPVANRPPSSRKARLWRTPSFARNHRHQFRAKDGGAEGIRTPDLLIANQPLYQLSYDPSQCRPILDGDYYAVLRPNDKFFWW